MEKALIIHNRHWQKEKYSGLFHRDALDYALKKLSLKEIQVVLGIRRCGKSSLFKLIINHLLEKKEPRSILYVNLDDPFFAEVWKDARNLYKIIETAEKITGVKVQYLFLDEVQNVKGWEKFVKSTYDAGLFVKTFLTGSNTTLLKSDYAQLLAGRYVADIVYPLSFGEVLQTSNIKTYMELVQNKPEVLRLLDNILFFGAFPEVFKQKDTELKREILLNYYDTIILKDCAASHRIRDLKTFKELSLYLVSNISAVYSYNSLARAVKSNENTVRDFLNILEDSFLLKEVRNFSFSLKALSKAKKKAYCIDNSFLGNIALTFSENRGKLLENLVYTEFVKKGYSDICFYNEQKECDFVVKKGKTVTAVQVAYELNEANREREIAGLTAAMNKFSIKRGFIVTYDTEEQIDKNIAAVPFWKLFSSIADNNIGFP
jgi:uncharacterized protein